MTREDKKMLQVPRWRVDVTVGGAPVKTYYEAATTSAAAIAKAKYKLRGAVSSAGAFKFSAKRADADAPTHATKYSEKASEKVGRTMHEFKRGKLKSGSGAKVTSREQAIAIGLSQARAKGYKVPPRAHATMDLDARVRAHLSNMRPGTEIDAHGMSRAIGGADVLGVGYALERAHRAGHAVTSDGRWFGPSGSSVHHARKRKSVDDEVVEDIAAAIKAVERIKRDPKLRARAAQLDREITEALRGSRPGRRTAHATKAASALFAVEIDPREFDRGRDLPADATWRDDRVPLAEAELARGRSYRRPKDARYAVVEWTGYRGAVGRLLDWLEASPGITRYAEIFE